MSPVSSYGSSEPPECGSCSNNDVDVAVGRVFRNAGHERWTAAEANLARRIAADDDELSVYVFRH